VTDRVFFYRHQQGPDLWLLTRSGVYETLWTGVGRLP
jgi:hypothetical protein